MNSPLLRTAESLIHPIVGSAIETKLLIASATVAEKYAKGLRRFRRLKLSSLVRNDLVTRLPSAKCHGSVLREIARAAFSREAVLFEALELIFPNATESLSVQ